MGDSAGLGAGLGLATVGAPGAGPDAGGGVRGPVDCAKRLMANKAVAKGIEIRKNRQNLRTVSKRASPESSNNRTSKIAWRLLGKQRLVMAPCPVFNLLSAQQSG